MKYITCDHNQNYKCNEKACKFAIQNFGYERLVARCMVHTIVYFGDTVVITEDKYRKLSALI